MSDGIFPDEATITIGTATLQGSTIASSDSVTGEVSNFSESGGEKDTESIAVFGGGNIDKETPRSQFEVSFDVHLQYTPTNGNSTKWDAFKFGSGLTSSTEGVSQTIYVEWSDGSNYYTRAYNNAKAVSFSPTSSADGNLTGTITFKLSPTDSAAADNMQVVNTAASTVAW